jgi:flagellar L-ring protein precursor FlgH
MKSLVRAGGALMVNLLVLAGCASVPDTIIASALSATPAAPFEAAPASNGAIYQAATYRPLFEDRRARMVGDILTISINEKTSAGKQSGSSASKAGSLGFTLPKLLGVPLATTADLGLAANSSGKYENKGAENASNSFSGSIGTTVIEVRTNGHLVVAGEKQIAFDRGAEYIRFYGVVNPDNIVAGNIVSSSQVADARFEYRTNSRLDKSEVVGMLSRFFQNMAPL